MGLGIPTYFSNYLERYCADSDGYHNMVYMHFIE